MSTTMTITMSQTCPNCGNALPDHTPPSSTIAEDAQKMIEDLQAQVRLLNQKATAAVDKWADYEDEIHSLKAQAQLHEKELQRRSLEEEAQSQSSSSPSRFSILPPQGRFSFLSGRKSTPNLKLQQQQQSPPTPPTPSATELLSALSREQALRQAAEKKLDEGSGELEELTSQLFQQANEMVATERKARAKLEERVAVLESRDGEKRKRLERLESAVQRIERVRGLLAPGR